MPIRKKPSSNNTSTKATKAIITLWFWRSEGRWVLSIHPEGQFERDVTFRTRRGAIKWLDKWARDRKLTPIGGSIEGGVTTWRLQHED